MTKGFWVLTRYQDVFDVSRDQERFSSFDEGFVIWDLERDELARHRANFMGMRPADHTAVKHVIMPAFAPKVMQSMVPEIDRLAREIVDDIAAPGNVEFVFDVASKLPVYTFCELMGIPTTPAPRLSISETQWRMWRRKDSTPQTRPFSSSKLPSRFRNSSASSRMAH